MSDQRTQEMVRLRAQGMTLQAIGDEYGMTRERVRQILKDAGVTPRTEELEKLFAAAVEWAEAHPAEPLTAIGERFGVSTASIKRRLSPEVLELRSQPKYVILGYHRCSVCKQNLDPSEFYPIKKDSKILHHRCKSCAKQIHAKRLKSLDPNRPIPEAKECRSCGETKPSSEFYTSNANLDRLSSYCKPCNNIRSHQWRKRNGERSDALQ